MNKNYIYGLVLALFAALLNGTVGVLSKWLFQSNLTSAGISFINV